MDNLFLFTPTKKSHMAKLEDLLKALLKMDSRYPQRNANPLEKNYYTWETPYSLKIEEYMLNHLEVDWKLLRN